MSSLLAAMGWPAGPYSSLPAHDDGEVDDESSAATFASEPPPRATDAAPGLSRFLADFTLGFADGLTVPFALTAGLSSLGGPGTKSTVVSAGLAEICAGCISMGVGGYLAARGEEGALADADDEDGHRHGHGGREDGREKEEACGGPPSGAQKKKSAQEYLAPLCLPPELLRDVLSHVASSAGPAMFSVEAPGLDEGPPQERTSPVIAGLSVALGYLLGGMLPLFPYFFVDYVSSGLLLSFGVCVLSLFAFGFAKDYLLRAPPPSPREPWTRSRDARARRARWRRVHHGLWEGLRMVLLGGLAAVAAVLCVRAFEGVVS
ncbi:Ccc1 family [Xylariaceae sp. FL0804]|nr:Ccc1 family [Xylariaceae sp. FL0804]